MIASKTTKQKKSHEIVINLIFETANYMKQKRWNMKSKTTELNVKASGTQLQM